MLSLFSLSVLLMGCESLFPEPDGSRGYLSATLSPNSYLPDAPEEITVRYYGKYSNEEFTEKQGEGEYFSSDNVFLGELPSGEYRFLAYSKFNNSIRSASDISRIEIYADTVISPKYSLPVIKNKQHLVYRALEEGYISRSDTLRKTFILTPMVQKVIINLLVRSLPEDEIISSIEGILSGVLTSRRIYTNQPQQHYASLVFPFERDKSKNKENKFSSEHYIFGLSSLVENAMKFEIVTNSEIRYSEVDLSSVLQSFTSDGMVIDIVIDINTGVESVATISVWRDMDWGEISPTL